MFSVPFCVLAEEPSDNARLKIWRLNESWLNECVEFMRWIDEEYAVDMLSLGLARSSDRDVLVRYQKGIILTRWRDARRNKQTGKLLWEKWRGWEHPASEWKGLAPRLQLVLGGFSS